MSPATGVSLCPQLPLLASNRFLFFPTLNNSHTSLDPTLLQLPSHLSSFTTKGYKRMFSTCPRFLSYHSFLYLLLCLHPFFRTILLKVMPSAFLNPVDPSQPFRGLAHSFLSLSLGSRILEFRFPLSVAFSSSFPCIFLTSLAQGFGAQTPAPHFSFCFLGSHPVL